MSELPALARRLAEAAAHGGELALATVVAAEGSTYRRAGAWMIVGRDGAPSGQVSGGCLEADLAERAAAVLARGAPELAAYDTRDPADLVWGLGLGCQGVVRILIEPLAGDRLRRLAELMARAAGLDEPAVLLTVLADAGEPGRIGERLLVTAAAVDSTAVSAEAAGLPGEIVRDARESLRAGAAAAVRTYGGIELAVEPLPPRTRLVLCGAGEDAVPLARLAGELDWRVLVVDHRPAFARRERFPGAEVLQLDRPRDLAGRLGPLHRRTAAVVMSHHVERDVGYAAALLPLGLPYLGLLGPRARGERVLATVRALAADRGAAAPATAADREPPMVFAPVGLDIASETPQEIALSIVAEISAVLAGRGGGHLRDQAVPIHGTARGPLAGACSTP